MAASFGNVGTATSATATATPLSVSYPTSVAAGDYVLMLIGGKPDTANPTTPASWTLLGSFTGGFGSVAADTGPCRVTAFGREATGSLSGSQSVTITNASAEWGVMVRYTKGASDVWDVGITGGADSSGGTAYSVVTSSVAAGFVAAGDQLVVASTFPTDSTTSGTVTWGTSTLTAQGGGSITLGTRTSVATINVTTGNDTSGHVYRFTPSASTQAAGTLTYASTLSATTSTNLAGPTAIIRLRAAPPPVPSAPATAPAVSIGTEQITGTAPAAMPANATSMSIFRSGTQVATGLAAGAAFTDNTALPTTAYTYTARGVGAGGESSDGPASASITPNPGAPAGFDVTPDDGAVAVTWTAKSYTATYKIYRNGSLAFTTAADASSWTDTGRTNGTSYSYTVSTNVSTPTTRESSQTSAQATKPNAVRLSLTAPTNLVDASRDPLLSLRHFTASGTSTLIVKLFEGATLRGTWNVASTATPTTSTHSFTGVSDFTNVTLQVTADSAAGVESRVSWASLATPIIPTPEINTKFYLPSSGTPPVSVSWTSTWTHVGARVQVPMLTTKAGTAKVFQNGSYAGTAGTPVNVMVWQGVSEPIEAQTIDGTWTVIAAAWEGTAGAEASLQMTVRVVSNDGTVERGVVYAGHSEPTNSIPGAIGEEFVFGGAADQTRFLSVAGTPVVAQQDDRIVVALGYRGLPTANGTYNAEIDVGDNGTDWDWVLDVSEDAGRTKDGWVGTDQVIAFAHANFPVSATDSAPATDAITAVSRSYARAPSDTAAASDSVAATGTHAVTATDSAPATDTVARQRSLVRSLSDTAPATDDTNRGVAGIPAIVAARLFTLSGSTTTLTVTLPPGLQAGDVMLLFTETANEFVTINTPAGWQKDAGLTNGIGTTGGTTSSALTTFWRVHTGSETNPTFADSGDHTVAWLIAFRGLPSASPPWSVASAVTAATTTSITWPTITTTTPNSLVLGVIAYGLDLAATAGPQVSTPVNSNLTNLAKVFDESTSIGNGGGLAAWTGYLPSAGATGTTTASIASTQVAYAAIGFPAVPSLTRLSLPRGLADSAPASDTVSGSVQVSNVSLTASVADAAPATDETAGAPAPPTGWESYTTLDVSAGGTFQVADGTNVKIIGQTASGPVLIRSNNNVVIMGLTITTNVPTWTTIGESGSEGLELQHRTSAPTTPAPDCTFHVEGVYITGPTLTQGIRTNCPGADVRLVNIHVDPIHFDSSDQRDGVNGKSTNHPDLLQTYGAQKSLVIDGFTGYSAYQGLFFKEDNTIVGGPISLSHVDVHAVGGIGSDGITYPGHRMLWNYRDQPITVSGDTVWVQGHKRNGWQPGGFYRERYYDAATIGNTVYRANQVRETWDSGINGWTGALGTIAADTTDPYQGTGCITLSKTFAASGYDSVRTYDSGAVSRDLSADGEVFSAWVFVPAGTPGANWKARLGGYKFTGNVLVEQTTGDGTPIVLGQWTLCTWTVTDPALTGDLRRFHIRVGADNVGSVPVVVSIDKYTQGAFVASDGYVLEPAPSAGTDLYAIARGASSLATESSDDLGAYATMTALTGKIRLGAPPSGEYVTAASVGSAYSGPAGSGGAGGGGVTRTLALPRPQGDSAPATDVVARSAPKTRSVADSAPATDATTRSTPKLRTVTDSSPATDSAARATPKLRSVTDSAPAVDTLTRTTPKLRTVSDSAPAGETVARSTPKLRSVADTAPAADTTARLTSPSVRTASDSAPAVDTLASHNVRARSVADTAPAVDLVTHLVVFARATPDSAPAGDLITRVITFARATADFASATDIVATEFTSGNVSRSSTATDSAPAADTVARTQAKSRAIADTAPATDALTRTAPKSRPVADTATAGDVITRTAADTRSSLDTAAASDAVTRTSSRPRNVADAAVATDSTTRTTSPSLRAVSDSSPAVDTTSRLTTPSSRTATDNAPAVDAVARTGSSSRPVSDIATTTDVVTRTRVASRFAADTAPAVDVVTRSTPKARQVTDTAPVTDTTARSSSHTRTLADSAPATDAVTRVRNLTRGVADSAPALDTVARSATKARSVADTAPAADLVSVATQNQHSATAADSAPAVDTLTLLQTRARAVTDTAPATDAVTRTATKPRATSDTASAVDVVTGRVAVLRAVADFAPAGDLVTRLEVTARATPDLAPASDTASRIVSPPSRTASDSAPATDSVGAELSNGPRIRGVTDSAPAVDAVTRLAPRTRALTDSAPATDSLVYTRARARTTAESAPAIDVVTRTQGPRIRSVADSAFGGEVVTQHNVRTRANTDVAGASDAVARATQRPRPVADSAPAADTFVIHDVRTRTAVDAAAAADVVVGVVNIERTATATDTSPISDIVTRGVSRVRAAIETAGSVDAIIRSLVLFTITSESTPAGDVATSATQLQNERAIIDFARATDTARVVPKARDIVFVVSYPYLEWKMSTTQALTVSTAKSPWKIGPPSVR